MTALPHPFCARPPLDMAHDLLDWILVRMPDGQRVAGRIVEVEAYIHAEAPICHAPAPEPWRSMPWRCVDCPQSTRIEKPLKAFYLQDRREAA